MSRVQSTVISAGRELERLVIERLQKVENIDSFLKLDVIPDGVHVVTKKQIRECYSFDHSGSAEPDLVVFKRRNGKQNCYVIELKDGHLFDTKKASAERATIHNFVGRNAPRINCTVLSRICCFNQEDPLVIYHGLKQKIAIDEILTGTQFCTLLEIDYNEIVSLRKDDGAKNIVFFLKELLKIEEIKKKNKGIIWLGLYQISQNNETVKEIV